MRVAIVHRVQPGEKPNLDELRELCLTAGYEVVYELVQRRYPHPKYNIGPGKLAELKDAVKKLNIEKIIFENDIKTVQEYNLAKALGIPVMSRVQLILEIFSLHASSKEAKLQIKLAELKYELSRAREKVRLAKMGEQPGFHGLGAYEADVYYNEINRRIHTLTRKLASIKKRRDLFRLRREKYGIPTISLVGYTNAGKSTLFNALASENVPVDNRLFTTLSTTIRLVKIKGRRAFLSDTVGFIKNLPSMLIDAFHSTLSEILFSDLILLVADFSEPVDIVKEKLVYSLETLGSIGAHSIPTLVVLNKIDLVSDAERKVEKLGLTLPYVMISALYRTNLDLLEQTIASMMGDYVVATAKIDGSDESSAKVLSEICKRSNVLELKYEDGFINLKVETPNYLAEKLKRLSLVKSFRVEGS
ncbi:MAG: GTPase HflX [Thaumarchaeota archaeon]|nr:GTPase HflX [Candidatus Terraquivivens yellowstonensis]MCL7392750.1 GTPase HflX [Candidatus Terraquivivens yellowstonensis]MCL7395185.1 GTPase HflX [Candidatus Terraquivivens yellowstonensis]MCL7398413.1 GTPase HflX [Candidatus Terraquivivens yellowstonensis]MCL7400218.1 GTPase HflX [Candidatus Terraquivivens yellowstonensis]